MEFIKKLQLLLHKNLLAIIIAFFVGLVTVMPQLMLIKDLGKDYKGIIATGTDAEEYYDGRIAEAYDGKFKISNHDLYEYKNKPYVQPAFPEITSAFAGKILRISAAQAVSFGRFFYPFLLYLTLYGIVLHMTEKKSAAYAIPAVILLSSNFLLQPRDILYFLQLQFNKISAFVEYTRPVNPQFSSLAYFFWFFVFYKWFTSKKKIYFFLSTILLGSLFYIYPYSWMLAYVFLALFLLAVFFRKTAEKIEWQGIFFMVLLSLLLSVPYWINYYKLIHDSEYALLQKFYGFYTTHKPVWSNLLFFDLVAVILYFRKKIKDIVFYTFFLTFLSLFFLINQQVITGIRFYPGHWHWYYTVPFTIFLLFYIFYDAAGKYFSKNIIIFFTVIFMAITFSNGIMRQNAGFQKIREKASHRQLYADVFRWLNENTPRESVVMADGDLNTNLSIYTKNNNYFSRWGEFYLTPMERFENRLFARLYLGGARENNINEYVNSQNKDVYEILFGRYRLRKGLCKPDCFSEDDFNILKNKYLDLIRSFDFEEYLKKYKLDYALWDIENNPRWNLDSFPFMKFVTEFNGIRIYKVI